ncbi:MAG: 1-acyl-sn-glycerol-3-phosphate acyltransferase [Bacteroidales bacterium]|nr:1-acyl-sn-glycerol-3-phosphate acyltransferase [Bacteroidales bacterium]
MKLGKVEKQSLLYSILKVYGRFVHDFVFYKKVTYIGVENIPKNKPIFIAPNHQNALMDALAIIFSQKIQPVFLARSDIFQKPAIAKILYFFKILPVFRIRDGKEKLKLNEIIYEKTMEVLEHNRQVVIFPEAQHINKKHVRRLKKGIQRIAFMLEEKHDFKAGVQIIPTGIYYSNYWNFKSKLVVKYGKPISVASYKEDYKKDAARTIVSFTEVLYKKVKEQVIHIQDLDFHDEYDLLRDINEYQMLNTLSLNPNSENKLKADQETIKKIDDLKDSDANKFNELMQKVKKYGEFLKKNNLKDWVVRKKAKNNNFLLRFILLLAGTPFFIYGVINNLLTYPLPRLITKKIKDRQFESSVVYVFFLFIFPIVYLIQAAAILIISKIWYVALIYFVTIPFISIIAFKVHRLFIKTMGLIRFTQMDKNEREETETLRNEILDTLK